MKTSSNRYRSVYRKRAPRIEWWYQNFDWKLTNSCFCACTV